MGIKTKIDYVDSSWNPWYGCTPTSTGCKNCYAKRIWRLLSMQLGEVRRATSPTFYAPLKWKEPKRIIVCSISDFFHEAADKWLRDQCIEAGVPFFFKQWGEWLPSYNAGYRSDEIDRWKRTFGKAWVRSYFQFPDGQGMVRVGKKVAGCLLDGREWKEYPK